MKRAPRYGCSAIDTDLLHQQVSYTSPGRGQSQRLAVRAMSGSARADLAEKRPLAACLPWARQTHESRQVLRWRPASTAGTQGPRRRPAVPPDPDLVATARGQ